VYWQDKLANNDRIKFPNKLLDEFAAKTDGFSFAYMKEALWVAWPAQWRLMANPDHVRSVSALLILAGDETNDLTFPHELMAQVAALRKELDSDKWGVPRDL
jgi:transitional endoplasmic reticulum ATPase